MAQWVKNSPAVQETQMWVWSLGWQDPLEKELTSTPVFLPEKSHRQRSLAGYNPKGRKESDTAKCFWKAEVKQQPLCFRAGRLVWGQLLSQFMTTAALPQV